jgi:hypothetical protein
MLRVLYIAALASVLAITAGAPVFAQVPSKGGMPMGSMKTTKDHDDKAIEAAPNQAQAPARERATPTYRNTAEDRLMREKTDDGAHDRDDTMRQQ